MRGSKYPNIDAFKARLRITNTDISKALRKSAPQISNKLRGKSPFTLTEATNLVRLIQATEQNNLRRIHGDKWVHEWTRRWGHVTDWTSYLFFDSPVSIVTAGQPEVFADFD